MEMITFDDFLKVELRVGRIINAEVFHKAKNPSYILNVDFGEGVGVMKSSAQITKHYSVDDLEGKLVVGIINFPKKQISNIMSECLITGFHDENGDVMLCVPDGDVPLGARLL